MAEYYIEYLVLWRISYSLRLEFSKYFQFLLIDPLSQRLLNMDKNTINNK